MAFNCKVFDGNGNLKKVLKTNEMLLEKANTFLEKKSTKRAVQYINNLKEPKNNFAGKTKFYDGKCVVCGDEFHPRQKRSKYCSHECQKKITLRKKS